MRLPALLLFALLFLVPDQVAHAQTVDIGTTLLQDAAVRAALETARADEPRTIEDQIRICEIPAPPFKEADRARVYADAFRSEGLQNVRVDKTGKIGRAHV